MAQLQTLSNALDILNELGKAEQYLSVEEISALLEIPESTVYRLLQTLEAKGFIERHARKKIGLGSNFLSLARTIYDRLDKELSVIAAPYMEAVTAATEETCILSIRAGLYSKFIKSVSSKYVIRFVAEENRTLSLSVGATSKSILAYEGEKLIRVVLNAAVEPDRQQALLDELEEIRKNGYAISDNEYDVSAVGLAVPVFDAYGHIYASLAIIGPDSRVKKEDWEHYIQVLKDASASITKKLKEI